MKSKGRRNQKGNADNDKHQAEPRDSVLDSLSLLPLQYLNFLLNFVVSEGYIKHQDPKIAPTVSMHHFDAEISSFLHLKLKPCIRRITLLNCSLMGETSIRNKKRTPKIYFTQNDSEVVVEWTNTLKNVDFVITEETSEPGYLRLLPVDPTVWDRCDLALVDNRVYLKRTSAHIKPFTSLLFNTSTKHTVGFNCGWPASASEWITRVRLNDIPNFADIERIVALGCKIIPATIRNDIEWEYSFHSSERVFFTEIVTKEQRNLMLLLTSVIDHLTDLDDIEYDEILSSVFLYACEEIPNQSWLENPSFCVFKIIDMILDGLKAEFLPNYFMRCKNILSGRSHTELEELLAPLEILRINPMSCLHFLLDSYGYSGTNFGLIFDAVLCDFHAMEPEEIVTQRFEEFVGNIPSLTQGGADMAKLEQAVYLIEGMTQLRQGMNTVQMMSLFDKMFASFEPVSVWCLLFTMERLTGTPLTQAISYQFETINIVEVFGSDFTTLLGDIQIPKMFSCGINMFSFASLFTNFISLIWPYERAVAVGLRYFLLHKAHEPRSVIPVLSDSVSVSVQEQYMSTMIHVSFYVVFVINLYRNLYKIAVRFQEPDLLVDMVESLERFCYLTSPPLCNYDLLADFYQFVGDDIKAREARSKAGCT